VGNTLTLYRRHSHRPVNGKIEWLCKHADSHVFEARPNPVKVGTATFTLLAHEPDPTRKREVAKDCRCPIVCDGSLANERERIRRRSLGTTDWIQAKELAAQWLRWGQLAEPIKAVLPEESISIKDAIERFRKSKGPEGENIDPATMRKYDVLLNDRLLKWCDGRGITSIKQLANKTTCEDFVLSWRNLNPTKNRRNVKPTDKLLSRTTKVAELGRLRYFLNYCVDSGWIERNGAQKVKVESRGGGDPKYGLNPDEYDRVLRAADAWTDGWNNATRKTKELQVLVPLLRWSGLRIGDAIMLHDGQVRKENGHCVITVERMEKTGARVRVPIPEFVGDALMALPHKGIKDGKRYWFWTCAGQPDTCQSAWRNDIAMLIHRAQLPDAKGIYQKPFSHHASTHSLRHSFACAALAAGATLLQVKEWLGHTSVRTTEKHYGHANRHAQAVLDAAYDGMVAGSVKQFMPPTEPAKVVEIRRRRRE
jgi:integrase/recombinase XerD